MLDQVLGDGGVVREAVAARSDRVHASRSLYALLRAVFSSPSSGKTGLGSAARKGLDRHGDVGGAAGVKGECVYSASEVCLASSRRTE